MIRCSAVKIRMIDTGKEVIMQSIRHHQVYGILEGLGITPDKYETLEWGFLTHTGDFLDRRQALTHALQCGQLSDTSVNGIGTCEQLFSEDLW